VHPKPPKNPKLKKPEKYPKNPKLKKKTQKEPEKT
jgi:hypothetical protein